MLLRIACCVLFLALPSCSRPPRVEEDGKPAPLPALDAGEDALIEEGELRRLVSEFASDEMQGRGAGTIGDERARAFLVRELRAMGCEPGGAGGSWEQPFEIVGLETRAPQTWRFEEPGGAELVMKKHADFMLASGVQRAEVALECAELVFAGYGIDAPEQGWDDFGDADVRGKILLLLNDDPDWDPALFAGERRLYYGRWTYKYENAARHGAAGAILIHTTPSAGYPWAVVQSSWSGEQCEIPQGEEPRVALQAWVSFEAAGRLAALAGRRLEDLIEAARSRSFSPVPLGIETSLSFEVAMRRCRTANVIGRLPGADAELAEEAIVFSAHHDHLGIGPADESGDRIYNGALDNGVAVAQVLSLARAFSAMRARLGRSMLFLFAAAEEQGLLGSRYFVQHPPIPLERIAANVNFELGNVWGRTRDVTIYGKGKSTLEELCAAVAARQGRDVRSEPDPRAGWYYRSDQLSFARAGVPAIWFKSGTEYRDRPPGWGAERQSDWIRDHYHRPSDELRPDWNLEGLVEDTRLALAMGLHLSRADERPQWFSGDEFSRD